MNKIIIAAWNQKQNEVRAWIASKPVGNHDYESLLENTLRILFPNPGRGVPAHESVTGFDHGDYQGTKIFLIADGVYQPSAEEYWYTWVDYGSCPGCDTLLGIIECGRLDVLPTVDQVQDLWTLCLHMIQRMARLGEKSEE